MSICNYEIIYTFFSSTRNLVSFHKRPAYLDFSFKFSEIRAVRKYLKPVKQANINICEKCSKRFRTCYRENDKKIVLRKTRKYCLMCVPLDGHKPKQCEKCKNFFDTLIFLNGKETKLYHRKLCLKCCPPGTGKGKKRDELRKKKICKLCDKSFPPFLVENEIKISLYHRDICTVCVPIKPHKPYSGKRECKKCGIIFLSKVVINGEIKSFYNKKLCYDCSPVGTGSARRYRHEELEKIENGIKFKKCVKCERFLECNSDNFIGKDIEKIVVKCRECNYKQQRERNRKQKEDIVAYKGGGCNICGYNKCFAALDVHHKEPDKKRFYFGQITFSSKNEEIIAELDNCLLLCSNCHREVHAGLHPNILVTDGRL